MRKIGSWWDTVDPIAQIVVCLMVMSIIIGVIVSACSPVAAQNGEPAQGQSYARTYNVKDVGEVTVWKDPIEDNACYFWGNHMFCVGD